MDKPNIVYIHSHDTGRYVEPYGYPVKTPNIQHLAEEGIMFRQAFCAGPTCSPSRAALLTGQYPHNCGMLGLAHRGFGLINYNQHIIHTLKAAGYISVLAGFQHIAHDPLKIGYDDILPIVDNTASTVAPAAAKFLEKTPPSPFFLSVGFFETHRPFPEPNDKNNPQYCLPPSSLPDTPETRYDMACFKTSLDAFDEGMGMILETLDKTGLSNNTLVICTTDHGIAFPFMKCNLTDHGTGVILIMRGPGGFSGGKVYDAMVSHLDIFPTICELLNIDRPDWLQGKSMMPLIREEVEEINEAIFTEINYHVEYEAQRSVRTKRWKYIKRFTNEKKTVLSNCDDSPSKELLMKYGFKDREVDQEQLYDLIFDPNEKQNLCNNPKLSETLKQMQQLMGEWMVKTDDPLLKGPISVH